MIVFALAQDDPAIPATSAEQQFENLAGQLEMETEDDSFLQSMLQFTKNKLNINVATQGEFRELKLLTDLQIQNIIKYRQLLGNYISIYELQSVPTLDVETIQKMLPYIRVGNIESLATNIGKRLSDGQHSLLVRAQQVLEKADGFARPDTVPNRYFGSRQRLFFRYKYVYRNLLQYGLVGDKDAGEQFFKGNQRGGFDFYSFHLFARKLGPIKFLALGDFTVNMGQGLIQWQSLAFKKSVEVTAVKRQADILRSYNSATEYNFQRGAGITVQLNHFEATLFGSVRKMDANLQTDTITATDDFASSIILSGLHRTPNEIAKKNSIEQTGFGGNIAYNRAGFHIGLNAVQYNFSAPLLRDLRPYNQYAIQGTNWRNFSADYSYTYKNMHIFGEGAIDKKNNRALLSGLIVSLDAKIDGSLVYRNIDKQYQALYGNAFTEGTYPTNENGLFAGLAIKPMPGLRIDAYADAFSFPWLRYRVDAPSSGTDYLVQLTYRPNKQVEIYTRYKNESKAMNLSGLNLPVRPTYTRPRQNWRMQFSYKLNREVTIKNRVEMLWFDRLNAERSEQGFITYLELGYKPMSKPFSSNIRLTYFETDSYDSRIYAFENDVLYSFSIPAFFDKGFRYYVNLNFDVSKKLTVWARFAQTRQVGAKNIGSGLDKIAGDTRTELKLQCLYTL